MYVQSLCRYLYPNVLIFSTKILLSQPHMTYFSPLCRLSPTVEIIHHPNLDLFSDHRKSLELFRNLPKSHWTKAHLKSNPNTSFWPIRSSRPGPPFRPDLLVPSSPPQLAQPHSNLGLPASPNRHHRSVHLASWPAWHKWPMVPASSPTSVRSKEAIVAGIAPSRRCTQAAMAAPFSRCETPSFLHYTTVVIPLQPEL
jgi:hypothetical protein